MQEKWAEQRQFPRKSVSMGVEARLSCGVIVDGITMNLSQGGLLLQTQMMLPLDCTVKVRLFREGETHEHHVECHGTVCRFDMAGVAIQFEEISSTNASRLASHLLMDGTAAEEPELAATFAGEYY